MHMGRKVMDSDQELALLHAVLAEPDSDEPRLVMADWYEEHGCLRGEFIRLQCALARLPADHPQSKALVEREEELLTPYSNIERPFDRVIPRRDQGHYYRGFLGDWYCDANEFIRNADGVFAQAPIQYLLLTGRAGKHEEVFALPHLVRLRMLDLQTYRDDLTPWLVSLIGCKLLTGLTTLRLTGAGPPVEEFDAAALAAVLPQVEELELCFYWDIDTYRDTNAGHGWLEGVLQRGTFPRLREVKIVLADYTTQYMSMMTGVTGIPDRTVQRPVGTVRLTTSVTYEGETLGY
jgi:uncharacterized protein (TIGR02996 family)